MMASSISFSMMYWRRLLAPLPASPVNRLLPLCTSTIRVPNAVSSRIREILFARNIIWQSPMSGMNDRGRPSFVTTSKRLSVKFFFSFSPKPRFFKSSFQGVPNGGLEIQKSNVSPACPSREIVLSKAIYSRCSEPKAYWKDLMFPEIIKSALQVAYVSGCSSWPYIFTTTRLSSFSAISWMRSCAMVRIPPVPQAPS